MLNSFNVFSQHETEEINLSPDGKIEDVYDRFGVKYKLKDVLIEAPRELRASNPVLLTCSQTSYFNLYFASGSGMENTTDPIQNARRAVVCKVFEDISNFINSPLSTNGNKVNIWVNNYANENAPTGTLGLASSFFSAPTNNTNTTSGVLDGEIWKTIHLGVDSYTSFTGTTNAFFHGKVAFNFNDASIQWHTDLSTNAPSNKYDLYTAVLHEVTHALGLHSFIDENGGSLTDANYYTRFDTFLRTNSSVPLLSIGTCSMYDLSFNTSVSPTVLRPGCILPGNLGTGNSNTTICNDAIKYVGTSTIPVYTPICYETGSSLSHFEDLLFPNCTTHYNNDAYFVMSNTILQGLTKRYLKPEERNSLCDIGYNVKATFGTVTTSGGFFNYGGVACSGVTVAGLTDGVNNTNGSYVFTGSIATVGATSSNVILTGLLTNDTNASSFECLESITAPTTTTFTGGTSGTNTTSITFTTTTPGLHLLRYVPINPIGQRGNITYVYVYIIAAPNTGGCSPTPSTCDLIMNGGFEQFSSLMTSMIQNVCGWNSVYSNNSTPSSANTPTYQNVSSPFYFGVPCNGFRSESSNNNIGDGYAHITHSTGAGSKQNLYTTLKTPLLPNTNYQLSFDVSLSESFSHFASNLQAYLSTNLLGLMPSSEVAIPNLSLLKIAPIITRNTNGWDTITFNFTTTTGGEKYLYLGLLRNAVLTTNTLMPNISGCNYVFNPGLVFDRTGYYIDNVSLIPTNGALFNLPASICAVQNLSDLSLYVTGTTPNGVFSGVGVSVVNGNYVFSASTAGLGIKTIGYTYTNSSGCSVTLYDTIDVTNTSNGIIMDAVNDNFTGMPIDTVTGGVTASVYSNEIYNGTLSSSSSLTNVAFTLVAPIAITGASINNMGLITIPAGTPVGTYTLTYKLNVLGNCSDSDTASVLIIVTSSNMTPTLVPGIRANSNVDLIGFQSSGKSIISGSFSTYNNISKPYLARLNTDLTLDNSFTFSGNQPAMDIAIQTDNKIIAATWKIGFGGSSWGISRLEPDGNVDYSFNSGGVGIGMREGYSNIMGYACAVLSDGTILLGGDFYYYNGVHKLGIVKLRSNGTIENPSLFKTDELNQYYRSIVTKILVQPDGRILLLGFFSPPIAGAVQKNIIRLMPNGSIDHTFLAGDTQGTPTFNQYLSVSLHCPIADVVLQSDKIIIVGAFTKYKGTNVKSIVRLTSTGAIDPTFNMLTGVERAINDVLIEPTTNNILIGGEFTTFGTTPVKILFD